MLFCKNCDNKFDGCSRKPCVYGNCGHTFCRACIIQPKTKNYIICPLCNNDVSSQLFREKQNVQINQIVLDAIYKTQNVYRLEILNFVAEQHIHSIDTICKIHKYPTIGFSMKKLMFVCDKCICTEDHVFTIKEIVTAKSVIISAKEAKSDDVKAIVDDLNIIHYKYTTIKKNFDEKHLYNEIYGAFNTILDRDDKLLDRITRIIDSHLKDFNIDIDQLSTLIEEIRDIYVQYIDMLVNNKQICCELVEMNYYLGHSMKLNLLFNKPVNIEVLYSLHELYLEKKRCIDYNVRVILNDCLNEIRGFVNISPYISKIENVFEAAFSAHYENVTAK